MRLEPDSLRFRLVAIDYTLIVTRAYKGDFEAALRDDDTTVAARVPRKGRNRAIGSR